MTDRAVLWNFSSLCLVSGREERLRQLNGTLFKGHTALAGESGAGKSSLLKLLAEYEAPSSGILEQTVSSSHPLKTFWVPQDGGLWRGVSVADHLNWVAAKPVASDHPLIESFGLKECWKKVPEQLSQGQRERLNLLRGLVAQPAVLLIDEPLSRVGVLQRESLWKLTIEWARQHEISLIYATHDASLIHHSADDVLVLQQGELMFQGSVEELYRHPQTEALACQMGPVNWKSSECWTTWLSPCDAEIPNGVRPEQLTLEMDDQSDQLVVESISEGQLQRVRLQNQSGEQEEFLTLPNRPALKSGSHVRLCLWLCLLFSVLLMGCEQKVVAEFPVSAINNFSLPSFGPHVPSPRAVHVTPEGTLLVLDTIGQVLEFTRDGDLLQSWPMPESDVGRPEGIAVLSDGRIAVADTHYHQVVFFDRQGTFQKTLGTYGTGPSEFVYPVALCEDDSGHLYVCEYDNERVQKFTASGEFVLSFGSPGTGSGQFLRPSGIAWNDGKLYIADAFNNRLQVFNEQGELQETLPKKRADGKPEPFEFLYPYDISMSRPGELCVVEYGSGRVSRWNLSTGELIGVLGQTGTENGQFSTPWGIGADREGRIYVADTGNRRIVELVP